MTPLAEKLRPKTLEEWVGHEDLLSPGKPLYEEIKADRIRSMIFYAPPGSGKTSLCRIIKTYTKARFISSSAIAVGVKEVKGFIEEAKAWKARDSRSTILFLDEIHRFTKSQQDSLLHAVEHGDLILIGATTENPSYELNSALISRMQIIKLESLQKDDILKILNRGIEVLREEKRIEGEVENEALEVLAESTQGDARAALNALEALAPHIKKESVPGVLKKNFLYHDRHGDLHHQVVSAFIKSMRAGETDAALYYLARLWEAGEDPMYIARRMVIFASEDIGNADLKALAMANQVRLACEFVGRPECFYALSQGVIFLSKAPKSREAGNLFEEALEKVRRLGAKARVPDFLINANTRLDKEWGRGRKRESDENFLPEEIAD